MYTNVDEVSISSKAPTIAAMYGQPSAELDYLGANYDYLGAVYDYGQEGATEDFLGVCLGGKKCKARKAQRQETRQVRTDAKTAKIVAKTQSEIANPGSTGITGALKGIAQGIFGGGDTAVAAQPGMVQDPALMAQMELDRREAEKKKKSTNLIIGLVVTLVVIGGVVAIMRTKKK